MFAPATFRLSKSRFVAGMQCLKRLYLSVHQPELADAAEESQEARLEQGQEVGLLAQRRFPGGVLVNWDSSGMEAALTRTAALINDPSVPAIFEATFEHYGVLVRVDILERRRRDRWRLIEVKSSTEVKEHYLYDIAIQEHVLAGCGIDISSGGLMYLNRDYVYDGHQLDPRELFTIKDLTRQIRKLGLDLPGLLQAQQKALAQKTAPDVAPGPQCVRPYQCEFYGHCNPELPQHHISSLPRLSAKKAQDLVDMGVIQIQKIPEDFPLTDLQRRIRDAVASGQVWLSGKLSRELSRLKHPLYYMDFESLYPAIPRFAGMKPYSHIPFQWSVHRQIALDANLEHLEFLAEDDRDPRRDFTKSLCQALGERGQIVVYNAGFESQRLSELATWFPAYEKQIANIQARLWDLWPFVKRHVYHPRFEGSFSLKSVLPALAPDLNYSGMEVSQGGQAGLTWDKLVRGNSEAAEKARLKSALLAYCQKDTLAMVRVLEELRVLTRKARAGGSTA